ncbi:hypothetical protein PVAND_014111 [Polypedilum vanderplanki]|uniref:procollagen-proline 4-dioxygenase n=1 Tax=Polypedilum vanderplanki TaxID=319348 RepID=A0A9J6CS72_POLVA|nr:hypothetical protein PVAND_014111 [Polypedilum vanderplanki]
MKRFMIFVIVINLVFTNCEIFSGSNALEKFVENEEKILSEFEVFIKKLQDENDYLMSKLQSWKDEYSQVKKDPIKYINNPINAFHVIKRTTEDIDLFELRIKKLIDQFTSSISSIRATNNDLTGTVEGIMRLQTIYHLKTADIINGIIDGDKTNEKLKPHDLFTIAREGLKIQDKSYFVHEYLYHLQKSLENNEDEFDEVDLDEFSEIVEITLNSTMIDPFDESFEKNGAYTVHKENVIYSQGCRQKIQKTPKEAKDLKCRYVSNSAFSKIAPFKVIEADHHSNLVVFLDVISDNEIEMIKNISSSKLGRGGVFVEEKSTKTGFSNTRVSQISWHYEHEHEIVARISRRVEDMTGLSTKTAEPLQVQNYGIAGHYSLHWDHMIWRNEPFNLGTGNRIATLLFYISTVEKGGGTIFPFLKVYVPAIKGSAAFWYNLKDSGDDDYHTRHASCPVILGSKWVINKWFHEYDQEFRRPCKPGIYKQEIEDEFTKEFY